MTRLDSLLDSIDPAKTINQVSARVDDAVNSFKIKSAIIKDWDTFKALLTNFFRHTENVVLRLKNFHSTDPDIDWGRCVRLLLKEYGSSGDKAAFEMVRTGTQGGLYKVLKSIARQMVKDYSGNEIRARISDFWDSLTLDEKLAVADEYIAKYGHLLPSEITEGSAVRIKANFVKVLEEHSRLIKRFRDIDHIEA